MTNIHYITFWTYCFLCSAKRVLWQWLWLKMTEQVWSLVAPSCGLIESSIFRKHPRLTATMESEQYDCKKNLFNSIRKKMCMSQFNKKKMEFSRDIVKEFTAKDTIKAHPVWCLGQVVQKPPIDPAGAREGGGGGGRAAEGPERWPVGGHALTGGRRGFIGHKDSVNRLSLTLGWWCTLQFSRQQKRFAVTGYTENLNDSWKSDVAAKVAEWITDCSYNKK